MHKEIYQAMNGPDTVYQLLQDMRPLLNQINLNTTGTVDI